MKATIILIAILGLSCRSINNSETKDLYIQDRGIETTCAFLIEGACRNASDCTSFPETEQALLLAAKQKCHIFDPINSYNSEHIQDFLVGKSEIEQKLIALSIVIAFHGEGSHNDTVERIVQPGFATINAPWISELKTPSFDRFVKDLLKSVSPPTFDAMQSRLSTISKRMLVTSNQISAKYFRLFLSRYPEVKTVYGLIGKAHIDFLDSGDEVKGPDDYRDILVQSPTGPVRTIMYGGVHGDIGAYNRLARSLGEQEAVTKPRLTLDEKSLSILAEAIRAKEGSPKSFEPGRQLQTGEPVPKISDMESLQLELNKEYLDQSQTHKKLQQKLKVGSEAEVIWNTVTLYSDLSLEDDCTISLGSTISVVELPRVIKANSDAVFRLSGNIDSKLDNQLKSNGFVCPLNGKTKIHGVRVHRDALTDSDIETSLIGHVDVIDVVKVKINTWIDPIQSRLSDTKNICASDAEGFLAFNPSCAKPNFSAIRWDFLVK